MQQCDTLAISYSTGLACLWHDNDSVMKWRYYHECWSLETAALLCQSTNEARANFPWCHYKTVRALGEHELLPNAIVNSSLICKRNLVSWVIFARHDCAACLFHTQIQLSGFIIFKPFSLSDSWRLLSVLWYLWMWIVIREALYFYIGCVLL